MKIKNIIVFSLFALVAFILWRKVKANKDPQDSIVARGIMDSEPRTWPDTIVQESVILTPPPRTYVAPVANPQAGTLRAVSLKPAPKKAFKTPFAATANKATSPRYTKAPAKRKTTAGRVGAIKKDPLTRA